MKLQDSIPTFLFYDYETFGIHPATDKPAQFACIRTDIDLNIISEPECFYCFPSDDYLPDPQSILITQIIPQYTVKHGMNEYFFSQKIHKILNVPNTCIVGYNNINFDDEITRNVFYRNFFDPYEWSWKNKNSRWDILHLLQACYALRPKGIEWPMNSLGLPSFKLSDLTNINNIVHFNAHDAIADVYATIELAKLVKKKQKKLFFFFFHQRTKKKLLERFDIKKKSMVYVSSVFGSARSNVSCIFPIMWHKNNKNVLISIDLSKDVKKIIRSCKKTYFDQDFIKYLFHLGIVFVYLNRCPILAPMQSIRLEDSIRLNFSHDLFQENIQLIKANHIFKKNIETIFSHNILNNERLDVDLQIYSSFFNAHDKKIIKKINSSKELFIKYINCNFDDARLKVLFFRYRARNFFDKISDLEKKEWINYCLDIFHSKKYKEYIKNIQFLLKKYEKCEKKVFLLKKLLKYVINKKREIKNKSINLN